MKTISLITIFVFALTLVSAITIYSGESIEIELEKPFDYYSIVGNSSEVILDVTQDGNIVTITTNKYSPSDSFEIIFFDIEKEIIVEYHNSGGGGGGGSGGTRTIYRDKNITKYVNREVEVAGETIKTEVEVEKIVNEIPWWVLGVMVILLGAIVYFAFFRKQDIIERGYKNNE